MSIERTARNRISRSILTEKAEAIKQKSFIALIDLLSLRSRYYRLVITFIISLEWILAFTAPKHEMADFEQAIESTGYGKFNYLLLLIAMPCCFSSVFETTSMSLILPSAECDLNLSLVDKGILNAVTYGGMRFYGICCRHAMPQMFTRHIKQSERGNAMI